VVKKAAARRWARSWTRTKKAKTKNYWERGEMKSTHDLIELFKMAQTAVEEAEADAAENPKSDEIQVVIIEPNKKPYKKIIPNELAAMNDIVGGYIEIIRMGRKTPTKGELIIIVNEEGRLMQLPLNRVLTGFDMLVGTFFISAANKIGDNVTIDDATADKLIKQFSPMEVYI